MTHEQIRELCEKATPGPWTRKTNRHSETGGGRWGWIEGPYENWCWSDNKGKSGADASFVAASRSIIPQLLDEIEALEARVKELQQENKRDWKLASLMHDSLKERMEEEQ